MASGGSDSAWLECIDNALDLSIHIDRCVSSPVRLELGILAPDHAFGNRALAGPESQFERLLPSDLSGPSDPSAWTESCHSVRNISEPPCARSSITITRNDRIKVWATISSRRRPHHSDRATYSAVNGSAGCSSSITARPRNPSAEFSHTTRSSASREASRDLANLRTQGMIRKLQCEKPAATEL